LVKRLADHYLSGGRDFPAEDSTAPTYCVDRQQHTLPGESTYSDFHSYITINKSEHYSSGLRWKLGINTNPCVKVRKGNRCTFCGFLNNAHIVTPDRVGDIFCEILNYNNHDNVRRLELYVSGSFFDDEEVSPESRLKILKQVDVTGIKEVVLETRPEFITEANLKSLSESIDGRRITIAVGVETMDDQIRDRLAKGFTTRDVINSIRKIAKFGMNFQAYLLLKPPAIGSERNAIIDVLLSSGKLRSLCTKLKCPLVLAIQPYFLAYNSAVFFDLNKKTARPPWLYTIALTLMLLDKQMVNTTPSYDASIVLGNEIDNVTTIAIPSNYTENGDICSCSDKMRDHLRLINSSRDAMREAVSLVLGTGCACRKAWERELGV
jgi:radical SAM enzyme (TIGR01210 family)